MRGQGKVGEGGKRRGSKKKQKREGNEEKEKWGSDVC